MADAGVLAVAIRWEVFLILGGMLLLVVTKIARGQINLIGILRTKDGGAALSPARVQLLFLTLAGLLTYVTQLPNAAASGRLPEIPNALLFAVAGSNLVYLGSKSRPVRRILSTLTNGRGR